MSLGTAVSYGNLCPKDGLYYNPGMNRQYAITSLEDGRTEVKVFIEINGCFGLYRTFYFEKKSEVYFNSGILTHDTPPLFRYLDTLQSKCRQSFLARRRLYNTYCGTAYCPGIGKPKPDYRVALCPIQNNSFIYT